MFDALGTLLPGRSEEEMALRLRIFKSREYAASRMLRLQGAGASWLNQLLLDSASAWIYAAAPLERLRDQADFLVRLAMLVGQAERLEREE